MKYKLILILVCFISSCAIYDPPKELFKIVNKTCETLYFISYTNQNEFICDTSDVRISYMGRKKIKNPYLIYPNDTARFGSYSWKNFIESIDDKRVKIAVFKLSQIDKYSWEYLCKNRISDSIYQLTYPEIKESNFIFKYGNCKP